MRGRPSAKRYAEAIQALALEEDKLDAWLGELSAVAEIFSDDAVAMLLQTPGLSATQRMEILNTVLPRVDEKARHLVALLLQRNAISILPRIRDEVQRLVDQHKGVERAQLRTAISLDASDTRKISERLTRLLGKDVFVEAEVDTAIRGGFVVRIGDRLIDGTIRTRLLQLKQALKKGGSN